MELKTVEDIVKYVKPRIDLYRQYSSKKEIVADELRVIFELDSEPLFIVVKDGHFVASFVQQMGKGRMKALKKLLYVIDQDYYKEIRFASE